MQDQDSLYLPLVVQSGFGPIYRDGDFVQRGSILGLAVDARRVVIAPVSGWIRLSPETDSANGTKVEIRPRSADSAGARPAE